MIVVTSICLKWYPSLMVATPSNFNSFFQSCRDLAHYGHWSEFLENLESYDLNSSTGHPKTPSFKDLAFVCALHGLLGSRAALSPQSVKALECCLLQGANVNAYAWDWHMRSIDSACMEGREDIVTYLLSKGACPLLGPSVSYSPLVQAIKRGHSKVAKLLIDHADIHEMDRSGQTPLFFAVQEGLPSVVKALLEKGAKACIEANDGTSPLHLLPWQESPFVCAEMMLDLLKAGADPYETHPDLASPHEMACRENMGHVFLQVISEMEALKLQSSTPESAPTPAPRRM